MKITVLIAALSLASFVAHAQDVPCKDDEDAGRKPARYYDHTKPKYAPSGTPPYGARDKAAIQQQLIAFEKLEEKSRSGFQATGCDLRTSFSLQHPVFIGNYRAATYGYQLAAYMYVCHVQQHVVKTVGEYRTVFRVEVNAGVAGAGATFYGTGSGDFYITDRSVRYDVPLQADMEQLNGGIRERDPGSRISQFMSQDQIASSKKDFDKINNGTGYVENTLGGYDPKKYLWVDRYWYFTKKGLPLFVPVTRKEYLEALLEYYAIESRAFQQVLTYKIKDDSRSTSDDAKKRMAIYAADKAAYPAINANKVATVKNLLASQSADWLNKQAIVKKKGTTDDYNKASNGLLEFRPFAESEANAYPLIQYNPALFPNNGQLSTKPLALRVEFRYEMGRYFSENLFNNFLQHYDFDALRKQLE